MSPPTQSLIEIPTSHFRSNMRLGFLSESSGQSAIYISVGFQKFQVLEEI